MHLWQDYSPNLFDKSHPLCLLHGLDSEVVCQSFIDNGALKLPRTVFVRSREPSESNSQSLASRVIRRLRRPIDAACFARLVKIRTQVYVPDVLHLHFGTTAAVLENWGALPDIPMVVSFYGVDVSESLRHDDILHAYRSIFKKAGVLHVLCAEARDRLVAAGCPTEKIRMANLPANLNDIPAIGVAATQCTRFLIPARFVEKKGHAVLLKAFKHLLNDGHSASLTCFGYGPTEWLERCVAKLELNQFVQITNNHQTGNFTSEYIRLLRQHDVVLAPSIRSRTGDDEGGPALTLVMAQAAGKPVIVSNFPGAERSVIDGEHGFMVPVGDVDALYRAMVRMVGNFPLWQQFGRAGRQHVTQEFSEDSYWASLEDWYRTAARMPS
jgi:glycosyltransferase involved in cell wall biosynthesis